MPVCARSATCASHRSKARLRSAPATTPFSTALAANPPAGPAAGSGRPKSATCAAAALAANEFPLVAFACSHASLGRRPRGIAATLRHRRSVSRAHTSSGTGSPSSRYTPASGVCTGTPPMATRAILLYAAPTFAAAAPVTPQFPALLPDPRTGAHTPAQYATRDSATARVTAVAAPAVSPPVASVTRHISATLLK